MAKIIAFDPKHNRKRCERCFYIDPGNPDHCLRPGSLEWDEKYNRCASFRRKKKGADGDA